MCGYACRVLPTGRIQHHWQAKAQVCKGSNRDYDALKAQREDRDGDSS